MEGGLLGYGIPPGTAQVQRKAWRRTVRRGEDFFMIFTPVNERNTCRVCLFYVACDIFGGLDLS